MATGAPGANGVWLYGEDDSEATFSALLNKAGATVNTQLGLDRTRLSALETADASTNKSGLVPVIPTSVNVNAGSGSYNGTTGLVTFGGGSSTISLNGVFTNTYRNYVLVMNVDSAGAAQSISMRFRSGGSDYAFNAYNFVYYEVEAGTTTQAFTSTQGSTLPRISRASTNGNAMELELFAPKAASVTRALVRTQDGTYYSQGGATYAYGDQFDGISIIGGGALAGTIQVYGRR